MATDNCDIPVVALLSFWRSTSDTNHMSADQVPHPRRVDVLMVSPGNTSGFSTINGPDFILFTSPQNPSECTNVCSTSMRTTSRLRCLRLRASNTFSICRPHTDHATHLRQSCKGRRYRKSPLPEHLQGRGKTPRSLLRAVNWCGAADVKPTLESDSTSERYAGARKAPSRAARTTTGAPRRRSPTSPRSLARPPSHLTPPKNTIHEELLGTRARGKQPWAAILTLEWQRLLVAMRIWKEAAKGPVYEHLFPYAPRRCSQGAHEGRS